MEKAEFIVLRTKTAAAPEISGLGPGLLGGPAKPRAVRDEPVEIQAGVLTKAERADARKDPRTVAVIPAMPMTLIKPMASSVDGSDDPVQKGVTWGVRAVGAVGSAFTGEGITVAVLDTGIDPNHPAFPKSGLKLVQKNFTKEKPNDLHGHGTHCAGTIFGRDVGGVRIGVAPGIKRALIGKVLGDGGGSSATIAQAIQWAVENGAQVISMSLGIDFPGYVEYLKNSGMDVRPATSLALEGYRANINLFNSLAAYVQAQGGFGKSALLVAASGNESNRPAYQIAMGPPAAATGMLAVGALGRGPGGLRVASFSNTLVKVSAPGVAVRSSVPGGGLDDFDGTSMATPHVAGVAALHAQKLLRDSGRVDASDLARLVIGSAIMTPIAAKQRAREDVGEGIVQAP